MTTSSPIDMTHRSINVRIIKYNIRNMIDYFSPEKDIYLFFTLLTFTTSQVQNDKKKKNNTNYSRLNILFPLRFY